MAKVDTNVRELIINKLTNEQYKEALAAGEINDNELYMTTAEEVADATQESHGYMSVADKVKLDEFKEADQYVQKEELDSLVGAVKNPFALNVSAGGQIAAKYDGSEEVTLAIDKALVGLELVDNTPDSEKSVAYAQNAETVPVDTDLIVYGMPADAKTVGDRLNDCCTKNEINEIIKDLHIETDKTLTIENMAADAKATGERIEELNGELYYIKLKIETDITENAFEVKFNTLDDVEMEGVWDATYYTINF